MFLRRPPTTTLTFLFVAAKGAYTILGVHGRALCRVVDLTVGSTPDLMRTLDKEFGSDVTTRIWRTVERTLKAAQSS